jgi:hypothetical protein
MYASKTLWRDEKQRLDTLQKERTVITDSPVFKLVISLFKFNTCWWCSKGDRVPGRKWSDLDLGTLLSSTLMMDAAYSFETLLTTYKTAQYQEEEEHSMYSWSA